jgi:hypothetical protein
MLNEAPGVETRDEYRSKRLPQSFSASPSATYSFSPSVSFSPSPSPSRAADDDPGGDYHEASFDFKREEKKLSFYLSAWNYIKRNFR